MPWQPKLPSSQNVGAAEAVDQIFLKQTCCFKKVSFAYYRTGHVDTDKMALNIKNIRIEVRIRRKKIRHQNEQKKGCKLENRGNITSNWDIESWLKANYEKVSEVFAREKPVQKPLNVNVIVKNSFCFVLEVASGATHLRVKVFNPDDKMAAAYCAREISLLSALNGTGLAPSIHAGSIEEKWYISDWVVGEDLAEEANGENIVEIAHEIGLWLAKYAEQVAKTPEFVTNETDQCTTWRDYLMNYGGLIKKVALDPEGDFLAGLPVQMRLVAKDDPHLGNYVRSASGEVLGIDFEMSTLRPFGWDIVVTARHFLRAWPGPRFAHIDALLDGWGQGTDCIDKENFRKVVMYFAEKTAHDLNSPPVEALRKVLHDYNVTAAMPAAKVVQIPFKRDDLVPVETRVHKGLRDHIAGLMEAEADSLNYDNRLADDEVGGQPATAKPTSWMAATCETCQGSCCSYGGNYNAYLKKDAIDRAARYLGTRSLHQVIQAYIDHVPDQHVNQSCFYHTRKGCALPREMRSTTCNEHQCSALKSLSNLMGKLDPETALLVVAGAYQAPERAVAVSRSAVALLDLSSDESDAKKA